MFRALMGAVVVIGAIALPVFTVAVLVQDPIAAAIVVGVLTLMVLYIRRSEQKAAEKRQREMYEVIERAAPPAPWRNALDD